MQVISVMYLFDSVPGPEKFSFFHNLSFNPMCAQKNGTRDCHRHLSLGMDGARQGFQSDARTTAIPCKPRTYAKRNLSPTSVLPVDKLPDLTR